MSDQFETWGRLLDLAQAHRTKAALREAITKAGIPINETDPLPGYYRCAAVKGGPLLPVAIWRGDDGAINVLRAGETVALERVWPYCAWNPVPYEWYMRVTEGGERWPDEPGITPRETPAERVAGTEAEASLRTVVEDIERGIGDNMPPVEDEVSALRSAIEAAKGVAEQDYAEITTDDQANAAAALKARLNSLTGEADKKREAEKRPHFEKAKAVDTKWRPVIKIGEDAVKWLSAKMSAYATKRANEEAEERRKAEQEAAAARALAEAEGKPAPEPTAEPAKPATTVFKGATGRAASIRVVKVARVTDYDAAFAHLKAIPEIKAAIDKVAQRMIDAGNTVPGVEVVEERRVA